MNIVIFLLIGIVSGVVGGALGLGGGAIMVPALTMLAGLSQHQAQGTALAVMLPPVTILAVWKYYQGGNLDIPIAVYVAIGFIIGALIGGHYVQSIPAPVLKKVFGVFLVLIGIKMALFK